MEFNKLPEDYDEAKLGPQKRQTEFDSPEAKLAYDAKGLIAKAESQSKKLGSIVDPLTFAQRKDDDIEALRAAIAKEKGATLNPTKPADQSESVEVDPRLTTFKADFDGDPKLKGKISWVEIQSRLLANGAKYLALAQAMEQGGQLFGIDAQGNPLISDRGDEPIMKGMNYKNTRDRVLYKHTSLDREGKPVLDERQQRISTGYEMFKYVEPYEKSEEILQYEAHTGKPFVKSPNGDEYRSSWVESGENPSWPRLVRFDPLYGCAYVDSGTPQRDRPFRGVRRLLRVLKA